MAGRWARGLLRTAAVGIAAAFARTSVAILRAGRPQPTARGETALLFGAAVWDTGASPELRLRAEHAAALYNTGAARRIVCAGGDAAEVDAMCALLALADVPSSAIETDAHARDSRVALLRAAPYARAEDGGLLLVSSPSHMHRLVREARRQGLTVRPAPARLLPLAWRPRDRRLLAWQVWRHVREVLAVWWYALPIRISTIEARTAGAATQSSARLRSLLRATEPACPAEPLDLTPPVDGAITSAYGWRTSRMHNGIDFAARRGQDVVAAAPGVVAYAGELEAYGHVVALVHGEGLSTVYAHLDEVLVATSTAVARGERIGRAGMTGNAFGPHLHFELRADGEPLDPLPHLGADVVVTPPPPQPSRGFVLRRLVRTALRS